MIFLFLFVSFLWYLSRNLVVYRGFHCLFCCFFSQFFVFAIKGLRYFLNVCVFVEILHPTSLVNAIHTEAYDAQGKREYRLAELQG